MSEADENKRILKEAFDKWDETKGGPEGVEHWFSIMSDNIKFKSLANGAEGATFTDSIKSSVEMKRYFEGLSGTMEMIYYKVDHYIAEGDKVVAVGMTAWKTRNTGVVVETPKCDVVAFKGGKIVSFYEYYDTAMLLEAAPEKS